MKRICFGTFIKVLLLCKDPLQDVKQYKFGQTLISSVNEPYGQYVDETTISNYARCERSLASEITTSTASANRDYVVDYFEKHIVPQLDLETLKKGICAFKDIIRNDDIEDPLFKDPDVTREQWLRKLVFVPSEVLADLFLIAGKVENHYGKESVAFIDRAYIDSFASDASSITFNARVLAPDVILTKTLQEKYFCRAFMPVIDGNLQIKGHNHIKAFRYRIESNRFDYTWLRKLLNANIGRYVFNRAEIEKYLKDDVESLGMEAAQYVRSHATGNELGEMLIYAFLEEVLKAPKLMSAIELSSEHRCSGIHFLTIPGANTTYELVYGASNLQGNLERAVDQAFEVIEKLRSDRLSGMELVNSAEFNKSIDITTAHLIKKIVIPEDGGDSGAGTAYGVFLGYTLDLNPEDYSRDEFTEAVVKRIEQDIDEKLCAMVLFFANKSAELLKTKLMKLLNYSDMVFYKENGISISGLKYAHLPYGPVPDNFDMILGKMAADHLAHIEVFYDGAYEKHQVIPECDVPDGILSDAEIEVLNRIYEKFKSFGSVEISDYSHKEKGYNATKTGQIISYAYAMDIQLNY